MHETDSSFSLVNLNESSITISQSKIYTLEWFHGLYTSLHCIVKSTQVCSTEYESECETIQHPHDVEVSPNLSLFHWSWCRRLIMPALCSRMMLPRAVLRWRRSVRTKPLGTPPIPSVPSGPRRCAASPRSRSPSSPQRLSAGIVRKRMIVCYNFTNNNPTLVNISTHSFIANLTFSHINH